MRWMQQLLKTTFLIGGTFLFLIGGFILWLHYFVQSESFASQLKRKAQEWTGVPVDFRSLQWDIGRGITVEGWDMKNSQPPNPPSYLQAHQIILKYDWDSLWKWQFDIRRFTLKQPELQIVQTKDKEYLFPYQPSPKELASTTTSTWAPPLEITLHAFHLDKGNLQVLQHEGKPWLEASGISLEALREAPQRENLTLQGAVRIALFRLWQKMEIESLQSPFRFENGALNFNAIQANAYGGKLNGSWEQNFTHHEMPYHIKLDAEGVNLNSLLAQANGTPQLASGKLEARTIWLGPATNLQKASGEGNIEIHNGQWINAPFFRQLASLLGGLEVFSQPDFQTLQVRYTLANQVVQIKSFHMNSTLFELQGQGTIGLDYSLQGKMRVSLSPALTRQFPQKMEDAMQLEKTGYRSFEVNIQGTLGHPLLSIPISEKWKNEAAKKLQDLLGKGIPGDKKNQDLRPLLDSLLSPPRHNSPPRQEPPSP